MQATCKTSNGLDRNNVWDVNGYATLARPVSEISELNTCYIGALRPLDTPNCLGWVGWAMEAFRSLNEIVLRVKE